MSKFISLKSLRELLTPLKRLIDRKAENINWNENDPSSNSYIANRTHYKEEKDVFYLNNSKLLFENAWGNIYSSSVPMLNANVGDVFTITWDGIEYKCKVISLQGTLAIGNTSIITGEGTGTGEPFIWGFNLNEFSQIFTLDTAESHIVSCRGVSTVVHKIPSEYLPSMDYVSYNDYQNLTEDQQAIARENIGAFDGLYSSLIGAPSICRGSGSQAVVANGYTSSAEGNQSFAEGNYAYAIGDFSHAEGNNTIAFGNNSHAEGLQEDSSLRITGDSSTTTYTVHNFPNDENELIGKIIRTSSKSVKIIGADKENSTITISDTLFGQAIANRTVYYLSAASGENSHTEGKTTFASGDNSHAEGEGTIASGEASHAEGYYSKALGMQAHAEGFWTKATATDSHAEGNNTTASGSASHAEGVNTIASGVRSHAEGSETIAAGENQHVQGQFNIEDTTNKYAHIVGNGVKNRSNAHTLDWNGLGWFAGGLKVGGTGQDDTAARDVMLTPTTASVGQIIAVKSVDGNGKPTEWETIDPWTITSPNGTQFKLTIDDEGILSATELT